MDVDASRGEGFRAYYITKIEELQLIVAEKGQNLRRLQAQRNELNAKGEYLVPSLESIHSTHTSQSAIIMFVSFQCECFAKNCSCCKSKAVTWAKW